MIHDSRGDSSGLTLFIRCFPFQLHPVLLSSCYPPPLSGCVYFTQNPRLLDDVSFHPCVRFKRWEAERILSFIPPDGNFRLLSYHVSSQKSVSLSSLMLSPFFCYSTFLSYDFVLLIVLLTFS